MLLSAQTTLIFFLSSWRPNQCLKSTLDLNITDFLRGTFSSYLQQNLISIQIAATCSAAPTFCNPLRTLFSSTTKKPRAKLQLAKLQMKPILSWPTFTCSGEMGKMKRERLLRAGAWQTWDDIRVEVVIFQGETAVCDGRGEHFSCSDEMSSPCTVVCSYRELKLIWSNTVGCCVQNRSISVCFKSSLIGRVSISGLYGVKPTLPDCFKSFLSTMGRSSKGYYKAFLSTLRCDIPLFSKSVQADTQHLSQRKTIRVFMSTPGIWPF